MKTYLAISDDFRLYYVIKSMHLLVSYLIFRILHHINMFTVPCQINSCCIGTDYVLSWYYTIPDQ